MLTFGLTTRAMVSDTRRPFHEQIEEAAEAIQFAAGLGTFDSIRAQHHALSYPTAWLEPIPLLARLAPYAGEMRLMTSVIKPPIHNPVELAHQVATIDQIAAGRFVFGVGLGYHEGELESVGATRRERVSRFEESLALMKALWTGEPVTFEGRYWSVHDIRMGLTPLQKPHPPIWNAAYSVGAARRAARLCDGLFVANQATWDVFAELAAEYRRALAEYGKSSGLVGANRNISVAPTFEAADRAARERTAESAAYYSQWGMQESSTLDMGMDAARDPREWSIVGTPEQCFEQISQQQERIGIDWIGLSFMNMPKDGSARKEYLQYVSEELLRKFS